MQCQANYDRYYLLTNTYIHGSTDDEAHRRVFRIAHRRWIINVTAELLQIIGKLSTSCRNFHIFKSKKNNNLVLSYKSQYNQTHPIMRKEKSKFIPFPMILHDIIEMCEVNNCEDIISWQPHGLAFKIRKPIKFQDIILPLFFKHKTMKSFMRQLYHYSFQRITKGEDAGCYHHKLFVRQEKSLAQEIIRSTRKNSKKKSTSHTNTNVYPDLSGHDSHKVETSFYINAAPKSDPNTSMTFFSGSETNDLGLLGVKDPKTTQELERASMKTNYIVPLDNGRYNMSKIPTSASIGDIEEGKEEIETEVDLYSPNLKQTSIFMETFEDDLQFSLVLQSLCLML